MDQVKIYSFFISSEKHLHLPSLHIFKNTGMICATKLRQPLSMWKLSLRVTCLIHVNVQECIASKVERFGTKTFLTRPTTPVFLKRLHLMSDDIFLAVFFPELTPRRVLSAVTEGCTQNNSWGQFTCKNLAELFTHAPLGTTLTEILHELVLPVIWKQSLTVTNYICSNFYELAAGTFTLRCSMFIFPRYWQWIYGSNVATHAWGSKYPRHGNCDTNLKWMFSFRRFNFSGAGGEVKPSYGFHFLGAGGGGVKLCRPKICIRHNQCK